MNRPSRVLAFSIGLVLAGSGLAGATEPVTDTALQSYAWLRGAFGTVLGADPQDPATAAPDGRPLDTWMREATLEFAIDPPVIEPAAVRLTATADDDGETIELAIADGRFVTAPDRPGQHTVIATIAMADGSVSEHAWSIHVPDRPGSWETFLEMPPIEADLHARGGTVRGERGHGCLTDFCQEVGYRPPAASLMPLTVAVGDPLTLELDDGSAIVRWEGLLEPQPGTPSETRLAQATFDEPVVLPTLTGLEPDLPGEWLLELRADYDRERGWQWYLFRIIAE